MSYLLAPATDRALMRRVLQRVDQILGWPRTHVDGEAGYRRGRNAPAAHTESQFAVYVHDATGATILHGALAVHIDGISAALRERFVDHEGTRKRLREWIADQGWEVRADLPGVASAWTRVLPRDGAEGSATGMPIAEGDE